MMLFYILNKTRINKQTYFSETNFGTHTKHNAPLVDEIGTIVLWAAENYNRMHCHEMAIKGQVVVRSLGEDIHTHT
jgi:hypothetical protein